MRSGGASSRVGRHRHSSRWWTLLPAVGPMVVEAVLPEAAPPERVVGEWVGNAEAPVESAQQPPLLPELPPEELNRRQGELTALLAVVRERSRPLSNEEFELLVRTGTQVS